MSQRKIKKIRNEVKPAVINKPVETQIGLWKIVKENAWFLVGLMVLIFVVYANSLNGAFVSDDYASITQNPSMNDFMFMFNKANSMSFGNFLVNKMFGLASPVPYHLLNLVTYMIACLALFVLAVKLFGKNVGIISLIIFGVLPIHVEAVSWISGRVYTILAIYITLALLCFIRYVETEKLKFLVGTAGFFVLGFLTDKPRPFSLFLLISLYLALKNDTRIKNQIVKLIPYLAVVAVVFVVLAIPYIQTRINVVNSGYNQTASIFYDPFFQYPTGIPKYFQLIAFPFDLTLYHTMYVLPIWLNWSILIVYLTAVVYFWFKDRRYFFGLAFIVAALAPSMAPIKVSWLVAERYIFLGSLGYCLVIALVINDLKGKYKYITAVMLAIVVSGYGFRTYQRNIDWSSNHKLWVNTCQVSPNSHNAWNNIGDDYDKLQQYENSIKGFSQSTLVKQDYADAYHNRANIFFKTGRLDLARDSYSTALTFNPGLYQTYLSLTQIDLMENNLKLAMEHARKAAELEPNNPQAAYVVGVVYAQAGMVKEAKDIFRQILTAIPNYTAAKNTLIQLETKSE